MTQSPQTSIESSDAPAERPHWVMLPRVLVAGLREAAIDLVALARRLDVPPADDRMSPGDADRLIAHALAAVGDPAFALRIGARIRPELFDAVGFAILAAPSYAEALRRVARYIRVFGGGTFDLVPHGNRVAVRRRSFSDPTSAVERAHVDFDLALLVALGQLADASVVPVSLALRGPAPPHAARYAELLGVAPRFDSPHDEVVIAASDLERPLVSQSPELGAYFLDCAEQLLTTCGAAPAAERVRAALSRMLCGAAPSLAEIARTLRTSERSLQRELAAAGTSFVNELDQVRHTLACQQLAHSDLDLAEIAYRIGLSGTSSLHRAFRRWENITPHEYRARARRHHGSD